MSDERLRSVYRWNVRVAASEERYARGASEALRGVFRGQRALEVGIFEEGDGATRDEKRQRGSHGNV